ncbi:MAG: penicillin-binding protein activator [Pseudomonadota bacterium]
MTLTRQLRLNGLAPSLLLTLVLGLAACETTGTRPPAPISQGGERAPITEPGIQTGDLENPNTPDGEFADVDVTPLEPQPLDDGFTPPHMVGRDIQRFAVLLPFSHPRANVRRESEGLLAAIELALFNSGNDNVLIMPKDTAGTVQGANDKAREALEEGADVFIGPLFANNVKAVRSLAYADSIPVIAFSNDPSAAGSGAYLVSISPEEEVERAVDYATRRGIRTFAYLGPSNDYGRRVERTLQEAAALRGSTVLISSFYLASDDTPVDAAQQVSEVLIEELERTPESETIAVLVPERGVKLRAVAPLLPYYGVDTRRIQLLGTGFWNDASLWREPTLAGGIFAAPPTEALDGFNESYQRNYNREATQLASQGYDAAALAIQLAEGPGIDQATVTEPDGFFGVNGLFRFRTDGTAQRGLSVYRIAPDGTLREAEAAPDSFAGEEG